MDELESRWLQFVLLRGRVLVESDVPLISVPSVGSAEFGPFFLFSKRYFSTETVLHPLRI